MKVVHVTVSSALEWGGPPRTVRDLTSGLSRLGVDSVIVTLDQASTNSLAFATQIPVRRCSGVTIGKLGLPGDLDLAKALLDEIKTADVVHLHELWHVPQALGAVIARVCECPFVVTPHGELNEWALIQHRLLKRLGIRTYQRYVLKQASEIHALTESEAVSVRSIGLKPPVTIIPNGIDLNLVEEALTKVRSITEPFKNPPARYILYLARLARGKGLNVLLDAFAIVCHRRHDVSLVIAGPDSEDMLKATHEHVKRSGIEDRVVYLGVVEEPEKFRLIANADVYALPSISEGMSMSIVESLACGTPVVISPYGSGGVRCATHACCNRGCHTQDP